ncbi:urease accessory protein UreF [Saccharospirillum sp. MSK14-1]|uniref:urease accessory protein UreF n=1 Tax=Saccharospirillum sp. MSK14-1 TaxID=1897632 RepID=UPI000D38E324|nr:urease accessory UreF family protein [Saccharospirillum sp. MSK14-1]PTY37963.1 urease accessory protein UreF [Saccharospirillum sp. MSK14-1]
MVITTTDGSLLRLLQLASLSLPVGGFSFSQGLESAIENGWLTDRDSTREYLSAQMKLSLARLDLPLLLRALNANENGNVDQLSEWNDLALACRETKELRLTDTAMGAALARLLRHLDMPLPFAPATELSFVTAFAIAASRWGINAQAAAFGYSWAWLENQVAAATKLVPLGQTDAQKLLGELQPEIPAALASAENLNDDAIGAGLPALAIASAQHEHQYSRLFRS